MEKETVRFDKFNLPIRIHSLHMVEGRNYRGMHSHMAIEIVTVKKGILHCRVNEDVIKVYPTQFILINSNTGHRLFSENAEIAYLHFDISLMEENENSDEFSTFYQFISHIQAKSYLLIENNNEITQVFHKIQSKYNETAKESRWYLKAYLYELMAFMYKQKFIKPPSISNEQFLKIESIVRYAEENYTTAITLDDLCTAAKYNKYTICHTFKTVTKSTIFEYINFLRVHFAVEKLRNTGDSILVIATSCGFSSAMYFNRVFKNFFGCSPSVYRKLLMENAIR